MASVWNRAICLSIFGESHGDAIGVVVDRLPAGEPIDMQEITRFMARRAPNSSKAGSTSRREADVPNIISGVLNGRTTGAPLCAVIQNTNQRSSDYTSMQTLARPGHADYTGSIRYRGFQDGRGGGHFSGRLTAPLVFAGAVCGQILQRRGVMSAAHILSIRNVEDQPFDSVSPDIAQLERLRCKAFPVLDDGRGEKMQAVIEQARQKQDSIGGIVECMIVGVPAGIGSPMFEGIENDISSLVFGIPAVRGIEFGAGFAAASMFGSEHNDEFYADDHKIRTKTNHHGGVLGGISSGMPILFRACIKPTPSIAQSQRTVDYKTGTNATIAIKGRHDSCIVPRAVPVVEAAANIAILSQMIECTQS